eukprot:2109162-Prymnesium_polylepis.2
MAPLDVRVGSSALRAAAPATAASPAATFAAILSLPAARLLQLRGREVERNHLCDTRRCSSALCFCRSDSRRDAFANEMDSGAPVARLHRATC